MFSIQGKAGFTNLTGVDYCQSAVDLAKGITKEEEVDVIYEVQSETHEVLIILQ